MRFSLRANVRILLSLITILAIVSAFMVSVVMRGPTTHASAPATQFQGTPSTIALAHTMQFPVTGTGRLPTGVGPRLPLIPRHSSSSSTAAVRSQVARAADAGIATGTGVGQVLQNFAGLNSVDNFKANGFLLEPPDQGLCVGNLKGTAAVSEIINDVVTFYTPNGKPLSSIANLNVFFNEPAVEFISDPRCYFDPSTQAFFFTVLAIDPTAVISNHVDILVLRAADLSMFIFRVDVTFATNTAGKCPCLGDQPKLGIDQQNVYITVDQFDTTLTFETGDSLIAISKSRLVAGASVVHTAVFNNLALAGIGVTSLQPAITNSTSNVEFLLNAFPYADEAQLVDNTISNTLGLWALAHPQVVSTGGVPTLSATTITSEIYGFPVPALTTNGLSLATFSNDSRMQQVQYINGHLFGVLDSAVAVGGDPVTRDGAAWFEISPVVNSSGQIVAGKFTDQGYIAAKGKYLVYPAITQEELSSLLTLKALLNYQDTHLV